jgi:hypothetical protein
MSAARGPAPAWFRRALSDGLATLVVLSLPGTPAADVMAGTKETWIGLLWSARTWQERDAARLTAAFVALARRVDRWPPPRAVLDHLPADRPQRYLEAKRTEAMRQRGLVALAELRASLRGR